MALNVRVLRLLVLQGGVLLQERLGGLPRGQERRRAPLRGMQDEPHFVVPRVRALAGRLRLGVQILQLLLVQLLDRREIPHVFALPGRERRDGRLVVHLHLRVGLPGPV